MRMLDRGCRVANALPDGGGGHAQPAFLTPGITGKHRRQRIKGQLVASPVDALVRRRLSRPTAESNVELCLYLFTNGERLSAVLCLRRVAVMNHRVA